MISIEELCERLHVQPNRRYRVGNDVFSPRRAPRRASNGQLAQWWDAHALPSTKAIAPVVNTRLGGAESVLELGFGTGFRLLFYALNNPNTQFRAIDINETGYRVLRRRIEQLDVKNIEASVQDIYQLEHAQWRHAVVLGIDCIPPTIPVSMARSFKDYQHFFRSTYLHFASLVDTSKDPSFLGTVSYGQWSHEQGRFLNTLAERVGLNTLSVVPINYIHQEQQKEGKIVLAYNEPSP